MAFTHVWQRRLREIFHLGEMDRDLDDELRSHIEMQTDENIRRGMPEAEARRQALLMFGGMNGHRESIRDRRWLEPLRTFGRDVRYAIRGLRFAPLFSIIAIFTLAIGIGANTALFSLAEALLWRMPPGISEDAHFVTIEKVDNVEQLAYTDVRAIQQGTNVFSGVAGSWQATELALGSADKTADPTVMAALTTPGYFQLLGVEMALGRPFSSEEETDGARVVVLGHPLWRDAFASDSAVVGKTIQLKGLGFTVIGVAPAEFSGLDIEAPAELWVPFSLSRVLLEHWGDLYNEPHSDGFRVAGRLREGVTPATVKAQLAAVATSLNDIDPERGAEQWRAREYVVHPVAGWYSTSDDPQIIAALSIFWVIPTLVLVLSCANVANLLLARAIRRRSEIGVRLAVGASRVRLIQLLVIESALLSIAGGMLGLALSVWITRWYEGLMRESLPQAVGAIDLSPDGSTFVFTLGLAMFAALVTGLLPALRASRRDLSTSIKRAERGWLRRTRLQGALVVVQVSICFTLLFAGGIFLRKLQAMSDVDLGFEAGKVWSLDLDLRGYGYQGEPERNAFLFELRERVATLPGVEFASSPTMTPLGDNLSYSIDVELPIPNTVERYLHPRLMPAGPDFFRTLGIALLSGRSFTDAEFRSGARVAVVSRSLAEKLWPGESPLGRTIGNEKLEIVGVSPNIVTTSVGEGLNDQVFVPSTHTSPFRERVMVRSNADPDQLIPAIRAIIRQMDPAVPVIRAETIEQTAIEQRGMHRTLTQLVTSVGGIALLLAVLGLYGVVAFAVSGRMSEIGLRIAIGASESSVVRLFIRDGLHLTTIGLVIGAAVSAAAGLVLLSQVEGVDPLDPLVFGGVASVILLVTIAGTFYPSRRAAFVDPAKVLRVD